MGDELRSQELIVGCLAATATIAAGSSLASGNMPGLRLVVGLAFTGVGLATASMVAPELAGSLAVLILTTTVFVYGGPLMEAVTSLTSGTRPGGGTPTAPAQKGTLSA